MTILMSAENKDGPTLEDLLSTIRDEILAKTNKIKDDQRVVAQLVASNNRRILSFLAQAEALQRESVAALAAFRPESADKTPRVGIGSEGYQADPLGR